MCVCVAAFMSACGSYVSLCSPENFSMFSLPPNKTCLLKWRENTRESITQLSRFCLSLQTEKNSESDRCVSVGADERDCSFQHKLYFNRECSSVNPLG